MKLTVHFHQNSDRNVTDPIGILTLYICQIKAVKFAIVCRCFVFVYMKIIEIYLKYWTNIGDY